MNDKLKIIIDDREAEYYKATGFLNLPNIACCVIA